MTNTLPLQIVIDASILIGLCAKEPDKYAKIVAALQAYANKGCVRYAPTLIVMEALYILCGKRQNNILTPTDHATAIASLQAIMATINPPPNGDASLIARAEQIRGSYGCSHSADSLYIALAEELTTYGPTELLTFDAGQARQAAVTSPTVTINLLRP